ncbi:MAG: DUF2956 family protein [Gammaproteobacteria bacterium]|nr:DUF2956 family protein [Gammaproteobacteria bacterium]
MKIAKQRQRPGQTKEQTKLIAEGIRKGIDDYKKQQKAKQRESSKRLKKSKNNPAESPINQEVTVVTRQHWLPWALLVLSWISFSIFILFIR